MDFILIEKEYVYLQKAETQTQSKCNLADKTSIQAFIQWIWLFSSTRIVAVLTLASLYDWVWDIIVGVVLC